MYHLVLKRSSDSCFSREVNFFTIISGFGNIASSFDFEKDETMIPYLDSPKLSHHAKCKNRCKMTRTSIVPNHFLKRWDYHQKKTIPPFPPYSRGWYYTRPARRKFPTPGEIDRKGFALAARLLFCVPWRNSANVCYSSCSCSRWAAQNGRIDLSRVTSSAPACANTRALFETQFLHIVCKLGTTRGKSWKNATHPQTFFSPSVLFFASFLGSFCFQVLPLSRGRRDEKVAWWSRRVAPELFKILWKVVYSCTQRKDENAVFMGGSGRKEFFLSRLVVVCRWVFNGPRGYRASMLRGIRFPSCQLSLLNGEWSSPFL